MNNVDLIQDLDRSQLVGFSIDYCLLLDRARKLIREGKAIDVILPRNGYRAVHMAMGAAKEAAQEEKIAKMHFLNGMAAALYGLVRLANARKLESSLGDRLGLSDPGDKEIKQGDESPGKDNSMLETAMQFKFKDLVECLNKDGVKFMSRERDNSVMALFNGAEHGPVQLVAQVTDDPSALQMRFRLPLTVPEDKRAEMAEATTRANYGMVLGSFEMDMNDGELNYKTTVPTDEASLSQAQFRHCMGASLSTIQRYMLAFNRVVYNDMTPSLAIAECER